MEPISNEPASILIRISEVFADFSDEIIRGLGGKSSKKLGSEYFLIRMEDSQAMRESDAAKFVRWNLPVHHSWPCNPEEMEGFVEKAAQALFRKFGALRPQAVFIGQLDPGVSNRYYKSLASNLRGRALQLFPPDVAAFKEIEAQKGDVPTLFCLVGKEGLFCGMQSPKVSNGFYPGGTKYISQGSPDTISRAGAKIAEALHYLLLHRPAPVKGAHWLELGASPGGMTSELLRRGYKVTALDRAPLDKRLDHQRELRFILADVATYEPKSGTKFDAILSDMNGAAEDAIRHVGRLSRHLTPGGLVIFTLKTPGAVTFTEINGLYAEVVGAAAAAGLDLFARTHLTYNRLEFTLFFEKRSSGV
ncbi:MAG: class I SAM-dependent methyltransferase [Luteolibacter sp.]